MKKIIKFNNYIKYKKINIKVKCKIQYAYRKLCLEKKLENYLTFIKTNNWIFSQYDAKRRCFS